jgi:peptidoglycan/xylan/chitin deacetylase (PgdA/CDA1 family)
MLALLALLATTAAPKAALTDRAAWTLPLTDDGAFDLASRAELLSFAWELAALDGTTPAALAALVGVKHVDADAVKRWTEQTRARLLASFASASASCAVPADAPRPAFCLDEVPARFDALAAAAGPALAGGPAALSAWKAEAPRFWHAYALEQLRLAALFPQTTSEILPVGEHERLGGDEPQDKSFLLTFDDGPTAKGGNTDRTLALLQRSGQHGVFFLVGEALAAREQRDPPAALRALYAGQCVGSHGQRHQSHATDAKVRASLPGALDALAPVLPEGQVSVKFFRPPYGQRNPDVLATLAARGVTDMLWNIDSQDWQPAVTPAYAAGRVLSLMLVWRRGIVLFHDVHDKAAAALPTVWKAVEGAHVTFRDCRTE